MPVSSMGLGTAKASSSEAWAKQESEPVCLSLWPFKRPPKKETQWPLLSSHYPSVVLLFSCFEGGSPWDRCPVQLTSYLMRKYNHTRVPSGEVLRPQWEKNPILYLFCFTFKRQQRHNTFGYINETFSEWELSARKSI